MDNSLNNSELLLKKQKIVRATGIILFLGALGLTLARTVSALLSQYVFNTLDEVTESIVSDVIFTVLVQVVTLLVAPLLVYKFYLKGPIKGFLSLSNVRKTNWTVCVLAVIVGLLAPLFSTLVNLVTNYAFILVGVELPTSSTVLPSTFNFGVLLLNIVLTAVLPGICEEVFNRGIALTGIRSMFPEWATVLIGGMIFGLFHQYVFQTFYTFAFGLVIVYITLKTKSIVPGIIIHFTNNFVAVLTEFAQFYRWDFFSIQTLIAELEETLIIPVLIVGTITFFILVSLLLKCDKWAKTKQEIKKLESMGIEVPESVAPMGVSVVGGPLGDAIYYKPTIKDTVFYWGALAISVLSTLFTLFWYML